MARHRCIATLLVGALALLATTPGLAAVSSYTTDRKSSATILTSVTAQRGGHAVIFDASKLISVAVTHFKSSSSQVVAIEPGTAISSPIAPSALVGLTLNDGLVNPGGQEADLTASPVLTGPQATPGLAVEFATPVVNLEGDDAVLFELQIDKGCPLAGDPVRVAPLVFREGLHAITITAYDIQFDNPKAKLAGSFDILKSATPMPSREAFEHATFTKAGTGDGFKALAVAIDFSALGYAPGEAVAGLFFQNVRNGEPAVDPCCIVGLPAPEPTNVLEKEPKSRAEDPSLLVQDFLKAPEASFDEIVFAARVPGDDHWYANFGYYCTPVREYPPQRAPGGKVEPPPIFKEGGQLCKLNIRTGQVAVLLDDPKGGVRDPQVHYDGAKILFSYRKGGDPYFHLYEIHPDGSNLKQLTDGPFDDIEPTYLADGAIMFCSDRCRRFVNCWITPVATLYACEADGSQIRMLSANIEHDNTPWPLEDGRVLYMRWEYVDRSQLDFHHLWATNPDGTAHMVFYGNQRPGFVMIDAKPMPGSDKVVASFSPGHGQPEHAGQIVLIDPKLGPDNPAAVRPISHGAVNFKDPYPLSQEFFLVARGREILLMDGAGNVAPLYTVPDTLPAYHAHEPRPLMAHKRERIIPARTDATKPCGRLFVQDIYKGRNMEGVKRGEVAQLLVMEQLPKPASFSGGMWPITDGGSFTLARILGTVPVEADGSANFELPALRPFFFIALDKEGSPVKRMQSFLQVMPGEATGCVGCHESRLTAPLSSAPLLTAMRRAPDTVKPIEGMPEVFDFPRDIQPILDAHCLPCHSAEQRKGNIDLTGDHTPLFCQSYITLLQHALIADGRNEPYGNRAPRTIGSSASRLMQKIDGSHHAVEVSQGERARIRLWIESSAPYAGTYAALGSGMMPVAFPVEAMERRCGACHGSETKDPHPIGGRRMYFRFGEKGPAVPLVHEFLDLQQIRGRIGYYKLGDALPPQALCNITRPEMSLLLRAPLAKEAGGLGLCEGAPVFANREDADYKVILDAINASAQRHSAEKRFDMPGFRPNDYYIYQMQRFGVLPATLQPTDPVDAYTTDKAYWQSFAYTPVAK